MKKILSTIAVVFAASTLAGLAQDPASSPVPAAPSPAAPQHERHWKEGGRPGGPGAGREVLSSLTDAERKQFQEARKKAEADPQVAAAEAKVQAAMKEAMEARKAAMLKADPTIGPILEKVEAAMKARPQRPEGRPEGRDKNAS
ncbi:MAG: hypothetical protein PHQ12_10215 [Chthoniobacteraceae bacterium]|nr:hypothetical protein [Chthoniobacteraceae bacterium]